MRAPPSVLGLSLMLAAALVTGAAKAQESASPVAPLKTEAVMTVMSRAVDEVIRPGYRAFHASARKLGEAISDFCNDPSQEGRNSVDAAFEDTVAKWSFIEIVRVGPVLLQNRFERILFYPDRKSTGLKQVQALLAKPNETDTSPEILKGKSVAMQGLGALEFVLYGTGSDTLLTERNSFRCRYGAAIAGNIETIAGELSSEWERADGVQAAWKHPGPDNPEFRDAKEAMTALLGILVHGAETVRDQRIESFYKGKTETARPKSAIYWRSGQTWNSIEANLDGLEALFRKSGMADLMDPELSFVASSTEFVLRSLKQVVAGINPDIEAALHDPQERAKIDFALLNTRDLIVRLNDDYGGAVGLGAGFSFADGD
ncbi:MAG: imelysin family protein [Shinella sp.]|nr:imelysin family protein [Shinella sp.]